MADRLGRLRTRTTLVATAVVAAALVAAALAMVAFVERSLMAQVRDAAQARVIQVAVRLEHGLPPPDVADPSEESIQVLRPGDPEPPTTIEGDTIAEQRFAHAPDGELVVIVRRSLDDMQETRGTVVRGLAVGIPALIALTAAVLWVVVGRILKPVRVSAERQRRFTADAAHELRSPIAAIRQHAEVASAHPNRTDTAALATTVAGETERLQAIVDDLLLLSRLDEGAAPIRREVDLDDLALQQAARLRASGGLEVDTRAVGAGRVLGDEGQLARLVGNLCDNAGRAAARTVALGVAGRDGVVSLTVDDDGPGIPAADRERVFDRFVRLDEARDRAGGGTGLGLSIVREVARAHGGDVELGASPLGGVRATVTLPAAQTVG